MAQRKYIVIGESYLRIGFEGRQVVSARPSGIMLDISRDLASRGLPTLFMTELGLDSIGDDIASTLEKDGVDMSYCDRYAGLTSLMVDVDGKVTRYDIPTSAEGFDVTWPRIEKEDVIVFGGYMSIDMRIRDRLWSLLNHAVERKATLVYLPDVDDVRLPQVTMVMPRVFENLEIADVVVTLPGDLTKLFRTEDPVAAFHNNLSFYTTSGAAITSAAGRLTVTPFGGSPSSSELSLGQIVTGILTESLS